MKSTYNKIPAIIAALSAAIVAFIGFGFSNQNLFMAQIDATATYWADTLRNPALDAATMFIAKADLADFVIASIVIGLWLVLLKEKRAALMYTIVISSTLSSVYYLKIFFSRARPQDAMLFLDDKAYPSGHAALSLALIGFLFAFAFSKVKSRPSKFILAAAGFLAVVAIGLSRVYLKVHFATDVLGGFALSGFWLSLIQIIPARKILTTKQY